MTWKPFSDSQQSEFSPLSLWEWEDAYGDDEDRLPMTEEECWSYDPAGESERRYNRNDLSVREGEDMVSVMTRSTLWSDLPIEFRSAPTGHRQEHTDRVRAKLEAKVERYRELHLAQRDLPIPQTLLEAEAILEFDEGREVIDPERLIHLLYKLDRDYRHRMMADGVDPDDITSSHPLRTKMWDLGKVVLGLRDIWKNFYTIKVRHIRSRHEKIREALAVILAFLEERAERIEELRVFLATVEAEYVLPPPPLIRQIPPTAPLAPPV